ncbi:J domain-containing protein [Aphelenchoides besseyi]|nr:J domain-containing protein [Aphelenchoides besseyi]
MRHATIVFHRWHNITFAVLGILLNILLIYVANKRTKKSFRSFASLILLCAYYDVIYSIMELLCQHNGVFLVSAYGIEHYSPRWVVNVLTTTQFSLLLLAVTIIPTQFYLRYRLLCGGANHRLHLICSLTISILASLWLGILSLINRWDAHKRGVEYYERMLGDEWRDENNKTKFLDAIDLQDRYALCYYASGTIIIAGSYTLALYFGYKSIHAVQPVPIESSGGHGKTEKLKRAYTRNLIVQRFADIISGHSRNASQSSTSQLLGSYYGFSGNFQVAGDLYEDMLGILGFPQVSMTNFGVVKRIFDPYLNDPEVPSGVIGLSWNPVDKDNIGREYSMWTEFGANLEGMCEENYIMTVLTYDESMYSLKFTLDSFSYSGSIVPTILLPYDTFQEVYDKINPTYNYDYGIYEIECDQFVLLDDFIFTISKQTFTIPSSTYVVDLLLGDGMCVVSFDYSDYFTTPYVLAQNHFSRISKAYAVLSDPIQRAQYENTKKEVDCNGVHVKEVELFIRFGLLTVDRFFQAVKTQIAVDVLKAAQSICLENDKSIQVQRLEPNKPVEATVRAHMARFFYFGFVELLPDSRIFDNDKSTADLFFVPHDLYVPIAVYYAGVRNRLWGLQDQLSGFQSSVHLQRSWLLETNRRHLLCIYGDNFFQSLSFSLTLMVFNRELRMNELIACGMKLNERKELARDLESEYSEALEIKDEER